MATSKKGSSKSKSTSGTKLEVNKNTSASIRQIENGFIVSESITKGKGRNQSWEQKEYFSATNPLATAKASMKFGGKNNG